MPYRAVPTRRIQRIEQRLKPAGRTLVFVLVSDTELSDEQRVIIRPQDTVVIRYVPHDFLSAAPTDH